MGQFEAGYSDLEKQEAEAAERFKKFRLEDPFPFIQPALLNTADISNYVRTVGLVVPFGTAENDVKIASFSCHIGNKVQYWDENKKRIRKILKYGEEFRVPANSIVFVNTREKFNLPAYLAIRFNLHILHVHRGLLLGTGPLVDPLYQGRLIIPLHNLTTNDYVMKEGERLIWVECTKLSTNMTLNEYSDNYEKSDGLKLTTNLPKEKSMDHYINNAMGDNFEIQSSLPDIIFKSKNVAISAAKSAKSLKIAGYFVIIPLALSLLGLCISAGSLIQTTHSLVQSTNRQIQDLCSQSGKIQNHDEAVQQLKQQLRALEERVNSLPKQVPVAPPAPVAPSALPRKTPGNAK